jgi:hypothetical protein
VEDEISTSFRLRFVIDERRERYYRVEVQNKVYRRELAALDAEINKLERMLIEPPPSPASSGSASNGSVSLPGSLRVSCTKSLLSKKTEHIFYQFHWKECPLIRGCTQSNLW